MPPPSSLSGLSRAALEALLVEMFGEVASLKQVVAELREEIARLKGLKGRPDIKPGGMDKATEPANPVKREKRRRGKIRPRVAVEDRIIKVSAPVGSRFKGYETYMSQELVLSVHAIRYRRQRWVTPDGETIVAPMPEGTKGHFGPNLRRFVLMQYHQGQNTLPRLKALLHSVGVAISEREIQRLLTEKQDGFLDENRDVLRAGLETSAWVSVDDTGARHKACPCERGGKERVLHADRQRPLHLVRLLRIQDPAESRLVAPQHSAVTSSAAAIAVISASPSIRVLWANSVMGSQRAVLSILMLFADSFALHYCGIPEQGDQLVRRPEGAFAQVWRHDRLDRFELFGGITARVDFGACQGGMPQPKGHFADVAGGLKHDHCTSVAPIS